MLRWAGRSRRRWWFELRPHLAFGTLELRVCDTQTTLAEAAAVAAYVHALVAWLARARRRLDAARVAGGSRENRFAAARHGLGRDASPTSRPASERPVRDVLRERLEALTPVAERLGCAAELAGALAASATARSASARSASTGVTGWLADRFLS